MPTNTSFLRSQKALDLQKWYTNGFHKKEKLELSVIKNATILPLEKDRNDGLLFGRGGVVVGQEFIQASGIEGRVGGWYEHTVPEYRDERVIYCGALIRQWGHFLVESVSRLWYFLENDKKDDKYVFISNRSWFENKEAISGNYREFFELLGVWDKVDVITKPTLFQEVLIPELGYSRKYYYSDAYKALFDRIRKKAVSKECSVGSNRIFLSRSGLPKAKENEFGLELLDDFSRRNGFEILYPEKMSLCELICCLNQADICAAESGTLPHNFLFCQDGKKVIVFERQTTVNEIQANLDMIKSFDITYIDAAYTVYPTLAGYGPYFFAYTKQFADFTVSRDYQPPESTFLSSHYIKENLKKYLKAYRKAYGYKWGFEKWQLMYMPAYFEAYEDSCKELNPWLSRSRFLFWTDLFDMRIWKKYARRILK